MNLHSFALVNEALDICIYIYPRVCADSATVLFNFVSASTECTVTVLAVMGDTQKQKR